MATNYDELIAQAEHKIRELSFMEELEADPRKKVKLAAKQVAISKQLVRLRERKLAADRKAAPQRAAARKHFERLAAKVDRLRERNREDD